MKRMYLWPVGSPYNITRLQWFGYMHTGVLWVLCMLFDQRIARYGMRTLKGSVRSMVKDHDEERKIMFTKLRIVCHHLAQWVPQRSLDLSKEVMIVIYLESVFKEHRGYSQSTYPQCS